MDDVPAQRQRGSEADRTARVARESAVIAKAEANIAAGPGLEFEDAERWFAALDHDANTVSKAIRKPAGSGQFLTDGTWGRYRPRGTGIP